MPNDIISYRLLPHYQTRGAAIFVTWRMAMTLPQHIRTALSTAKLLDEASLNIHSERIRNLRRYHLAIKQFELFDEFLATTDTPNYLLNNKDILPYVIEPLHYLDGKKIKLICYSVMPNHVHCMFIPMNKAADEMYSLTDIMHSLKGYSAHQLTKQLNLNGAVWNKEYWDHSIRNDQEMKHFILYTMMNPVKAGLCNKWNEWKGSWVTDELQDALKGELG